MIDESEINNEKVHIGSTVKVYDKNFDEEVIYQIVGSSETDPLNGKISDESPVGLALLDKSVGDIVKVEAAGGELELVVLEISM